MFFHHVPRATYQTPPSSRRAEFSPHVSPLAGFPHAAPTANRFYTAMNLDHHPAHQAGWRWPVREWGESIMLKQKKKRCLVRIFIHIYRHDKCGCGRCKMCGHSATSFRRRCCGGFPAAGGSTAEERVPRQK
ncbi:hypothetical protein E2C01_013298 [Portunus trituberculatus]|uniref:Uncharacterized protein n=1 Tax=Portunus trituberculatus TaxID=210409 RepID=A0A5B7DGQ0_PORTR|nr:hypothetical protein [Portunus trituberculatus]